MTISKNSESYEKVQEVLGKINRLFKYSGSGYIADEEYRQAADSLTSVERFIDEVSAEVQEEYENTKKLVYQPLIQKELDGIQRILGRRAKYGRFSRKKYAFTDPIVGVVDRSRIEAKWKQAEEYYKEAGINIPVETENLKKKLYTMCMKDSFEESKEYLQNGWVGILGELNEEKKPPHPIRALDFMEDAKGYADRGGLDIPRGAKKLEKKIYKKLTEESLNKAQKNFDSGRQLPAKKSLDKAEEYTHAGNLKVSKKFKKLREQLEGSTE